MEEERESENERGDRRGIGKEEVGVQGGQQWSGSKITVLSFSV